MAETLLGLVLGALVATPIVFLLTSGACAKFWRCVPCVDGKPIDVAKNARIVDDYTNQRVQ